MKLPAKPISSPGRAEKYPPPLMRFLRSNVASRSKSRGRSRSSPMFVRRKNTSASSATAIETQEPSSPKVTCMGQVRVKRSKNQNQSKTRSGKSKRRCKWIRNALFCRKFAGKLKPKCSTKPDWRKWVMFFHCGFKRKSKISEEKPKIEPEFSNRSEEGEDSGEEEEAINKARDYFSGAVSPPKNALLLTRSRSAPYRSSSLACRFWGSPVKNEETEQKQSISSPVVVNDEETEQKQSISNTEDYEIRSPESENLCKNSDQLDEDNEELEDSIKNPSKIEGESESVHPLILTRCKSEPARIAEKLHPDLSLLKKTKVGFYIIN